ncbi:thyroid transcription factor 1-associated protein 26 homolog [Lytechinus variegatus]|uniref:thyroid transcription factor 1-associated protein 26 homolog n=1 Tax=Lytechinus variegatus TaxID=7654 RepID=UPI001BB168D0|nr:thyroid transcription factor 1-associated protein 26 homolog [Lytechinus variegatus]
MQSPQVKSSHNKYRSRIIGNVKEGQGYADKRKRRFLNNYQKLRRKQRLQAERRQSENETDTSDINSFAKNIQSASENINLSAKNVQSTSENGERDFNPTSKHDFIPKRSEEGIGERTQKNLIDRSEGEERTGENVVKKKRFKKRGGKKNAKNRFSKAQAEFTEKRRAEEIRVQNLKQQQTERALALERYNKKKNEQHQKLKKKSRRGQPLMKYHMEVLLDKIKAQER